MILLGLLSAFFISVSAIPGGPPVAIHPGARESTFTTLTGPLDWTLAASSQAPRRREGSAVAYDPVRQRVVLFGGFDENASPLNDTWEWDGNRWHRAVPLRSPAARSYHAMAFDGSRIILYGGCGSATMCSNPFGDTWAWNGTDWTELHPAEVPDPNRSGHAMVYDPSQGQIVMYGGYNLIPLFDTVVWDGATWINRTPAVGPGGLRYPGMAYDAPRHRVILFGGQGSSGFDRNDTWEWDGATALWTQRHPATNPSARERHAMAATPGGVLLHGGLGGNHETFEWDGSNWIPRPTAARPRADGVAMAYDAARNVAVIFGGLTTDEFHVPVRLDETWEWNGIDWNDRTTLSTPPSVRDPADVHVVYDEGSRRLLYFRGYADEESAFVGDLWVWDGSGWSVRRPATSPHVRSTTIAYDSARHRVVLFGGYDDFPEFKDKTWEWNGTDWTERVSVQHPSKRADHGMVYDRARHETVLYGGQLRSTVGGIQTYGDTWVWNGDYWIYRPDGPGGSGVPRHSFAMAYDAGRQRTVRFGGCASPGAGCPTPYNDTWEWDGESWIRKNSPHKPAARYGGGMAYDEARGRIVLFGGRTGLGENLNDTWEWDGTDWTQLAPVTSPKRPESVALEYDAHRGRLVALESTLSPAGEGTETWEYGGVDTCGGAVAVESFTPGALTDAVNASAALGAADGVAVSLGSEGSVVLRVVPIQDRPGTDAVIVEQGAADGDVDENFLVEAGADGADFVRVAICAGGRCAIDLSATGVVTANYLRLTDLVPTESGVVSPRVGADIDAVEVRHCAPEICDGLDNDGDLVVDEDCDRDGDGYCAAGLVVVGTPAACPGGGGDCDDADPAVHPGAAHLCDGVASDCADPNWPFLPPAEADYDGDTFAQCEGDCDDGNSLRYPGAFQLCDRTNNDCADPSWPAVPVAELDQDGDGYAPCEGDCDDGSATRYPGAPETCNGLDDNCNEFIDEAVLTSFYHDVDGDGWGDASAPILACAQPPGTITQGGDCDDTNALVNPSRAEVPCNGIDDDCDGLDGFGLDPDHDGVAGVCDNCPAAFNPSQADVDHDAVGDLCDNCLSAWNQNQANVDGDTLGDACDDCPLVYDYQEDFEHDGVGDACDNCPYDQNRSQADLDGDHAGDVCDLDDGLIMLFRTEAGFIEWQAEAGVSAFNVYEGDLSVLRATGVYSQAPGSNPLAQRTCGVGVPYIDDSGAPPSGGVQFSLVTGVTGGIEGSLGADSSGATRPNANPCP